MNSAIYDVLEFFCGIVLCWYDYPRIFTHTSIMTVFSSGYEIGVVSEERRKVKEQMAKWVSDGKEVLQSVKLLTPRSTVVCIIS